MRPNLHLITEHRSRRHRAARRATPGRLRDAVEAPLAPREPAQTDLAHPDLAQTDLAQTEAHPELTQAELLSLREDLRIPDIALKRVRESGGPLDHACYGCQCGYVFEADVSTTVECPHCGTPQAW